MTKFFRGSVFYTTLKTYQYQKIHLKFVDLAAVTVISCQHVDAAYHCGPPIWCHGLLALPTGAVALYYVAPVLCHGPSELYCESQESSPGHLL